MIVNAMLRRIEMSGGVAQWLRAARAGLVMKKQTGASFGDLLRMARGMTSHGGLTLAQAMSAAAVPALIQRAVVDGKPDEGLMATGLVAGRLAELPSCAELVRSIVADAEARLASLAPLARPEAA